MLDSNSPVIDRENRREIWRSALNQLIYLYYGNSAGLRNNLGAAHHLNKLRNSYKKKYGLLNTSDGKKKAIELTRNGYITLSNVIDKNKIQNFKIIKKE